MRGIKLIFLYSIIMFFNPGDAFTTDSIVLPDPIIFQKVVLDCIPLLNKNSVNKAFIYPKQITYDIVKRKITGIIAIYDKSVGFDNVENVINKDYEKWRIKSLDSKEVDVRVWRVKPSGFVIQLGKDDDGDVQVIFMKFHDRS